MKLIRIIGLCTFLPYFSFAQEVTKTVKINTVASDVTKSGYLYEAFKIGKAISKDGSYAKAAMNFNCMTNEMLFITAKGDTLKMLNPAATPVVVISSDTFCFSKGNFLRKITHYANAPDLFEKLSMKHIDNEKQGAYGYSAVTGDAASSTFVSRGGTTYLEEDKNMVFKCVSEPFLSDGKGNYLPIKQASFYKLFPKYKDQLKTFIATNKIDFDKREQVGALLDYMQKLQSSPASGS